MPLVLGIGITLFGAFGGGNMIPLDDYINYLISAGVITAATSGSYDVEGSFRLAEEVVENLVGVPVVGVTETRYYDIPPYGQREIPIDPLLSLGSLTIEGWTPDTYYLSPSNAPYTSILLPVGYIDHRPGPSVHNSVAVSGTFGLCTEWSSAPYLVRYALFTIASSFLFSQFSDTDSIKLGQDTFSFSDDRLLVNRAVNKYLSRYMRYIS